VTSFLITGIEHGLTGDADGTRFTGGLRVREGRIAEIGALTPEPGERVVNATGCVVTPGLVNTHHHLFQSLLKAVPDGLNAGLDIWLQKVPYAFWPYVNGEILRISARVGLAELALSGVTTCSDHHYIFDAGDTDDASDLLFEEAARFGMRFVLARGGGTKGRDYFDDPAMPGPFCEPIETLLDRIDRTAARWNDPAPDAMTRVAVAPTTPTFNVEPETLVEIAAFARARGLRLHSHLSENRTYVDYTLDRYGQRPVPWLARQGWLGEDVWFAHLVEIDAGEIALLAETGTGMAHCPQANARLGSGIAPADAFHAAGGAVSIGVDGAGANEAADMGAALYAAFTMHRATKGAAATRAETVLHWASAGGARVLGLPGIGTLAPGRAADIAIFDISAPRNMGLHDPALAPVITGAAQVRHSFCAGRPVVVDGRLPWLDPGELGDAAARATAYLIERRQRARAEA
jgi:cytosine/adenosine deaminase-related metal-dependent hydrolase